MWPGRRDAGRSRSPTSTLQLRRSYPTTPTFLFSNLRAQYPSTEGSSLLYRDLHAANAPRRLLLQLRTRHMDQDHCSGQNWCQIILCHVVASASCLCNHSSHVIFLQSSAMLPAALHISLHNTRIIYSHGLLDDPCAAAA